MRTELPAAGRQCGQTTVPDGAGCHAGVFLDGLADHALIHYGDDVVEITRDMAAADVTAA